MAIDLEVLEKAKQVRREIKVMQGKVKELAKPALKDISLLPSIHDYLSKELRAVRKKDAIIIEIIILLYCYHPLSLIGNQPNGVLLKEITKVLGLSYQNFLQYKQKVVVYYRTYNDIRAFADKLYENVLNEFIEEKS